MLMEARPDLLGSVTAYFDGDDFTSVAYFTSEADAREGERSEMPAEAADKFAEWQEVVKVDTYMDITDPWLVKT